MIRVDAASRPSSLPSFSSAPSPAPPVAPADPLAGDLDPIAELRLRRWARERHVPAADRDPRWHPVVWREMAARDAELLARPRLNRPA